MSGCELLFPQQDRRSSASRQDGEQGLELPPLTEPPAKPHTPVSKSYLQSSKQTNLWRRDSLEINLHASKDSDKGTEAVQWRKESLSDMWGWKSGMPT